MKLVKLFLVLGIFFILLNAILYYMMRDQLAFAKQETERMAKTVCTCRFSESRSLETCLSALPQGSDVFDITETGTAITSSTILGLVSTKAVYTPERGCNTL